MNFSNLMKETGKTTELFICGIYGLPWQYKKMMDIFLLMFQLFRVSFQNFEKTFWGGVPPILTALCLVCPLVNSTTVYLTK